MRTAARISEPGTRGLTRRAALAAGVAALAGPPASARGETRAAVTVRDDLAGRPISPLVFGSNEIGAMDGGPLSAELDARAGVTARRLGGNLMTTYDWATNLSNAGKDWNYANAYLLPDAMRLSDEERRRPHAVIDAMLAASRAMGAKSLVTLPLAGFVAADADGPVPPADFAPSRRFKPVRWDGRTLGDAPIDPSVCDIPQLLARLVERHGTAAEGGIWGYALDNEPGLWSETHPRVAREKPTVASLIERSVTAAKVVKAIDPGALVFGPASWGPSEFATFQDAPDWPDYARFDSFLGAYLDAFAKASERAGTRLLDALDVHWYPYSRRGDLFRTEDPRLASALLDAPRSLDEPGFVEDSWVPQVLRPGAEEGIGLPLLPSLRRTVERFFPGVGIAVTEFNYGGAGQVASGLALADALGRFCAGGVMLASHWGSLAGFLGEAYRLYRAEGGFGGEALGVEGGDGRLSVFAARTAPGGRVDVVVLNKAEAPVAVDLRFAGALRGGVPGSAHGFDAARPETGPVDAAAEAVEGGVRLALPPRAARRYLFG